MRIKNFRSWTVGLIFLIALLRYWPVKVPFDSCTVGYESLAVACSLAHRGTFADPFWILQTGPTAHVAPLFPLLVSGLFKLFGNGPDGLYALQWVAALTFALQVSLWPWLAEQLGMGFLSGVIGAGAWLCVGFVLWPMWEAPQVAALVPVLAVCTYRILSRPVPTRFVWLTGVVWGLTLLFNPAPMFVDLALAIGIVWLSPIPRIQKLGLLLSPFLVISPWLLRNYAVFHRAVPIRDNFGLELWLSNNPCASFSFDYNEKMNCYDHPNKSLAQAQEVRAIGEYEYNREKLHQALGWIRANPRKFVHLTKQRLSAFWFFVPGWSNLETYRISSNTWLAWLTVPLSIGGLWLLFQKDRPASLICVAWLVLFPPVYYFVQFTPRYRYPIMWASFVPAAFFLKEAARRAWQMLRKDTRPVFAPDPGSSGI